MRDVAATLTSPDATSGSAAPAAVHTRLGAARRGARGTIMGIQPPPARAADAIDGAELERRLLEMGFVEGARFEVLHEGPLGADPIAVKVDETRVALRRRDANALIVETDTHKA